MVATLWPPSWKDVVSTMHAHAQEHQLISFKNDLPQVRPEQKHLCLELIHAIEARRTCKNLLPVQSLDDGPLVNVLTHRFQQLLDIVEEAMALTKSAEHVNIPEAMFRSPFDRLVHLFFEGEDSQCEGRVSM